MLDYTFTPINNLTTEKLCKIKLTSYETKVLFAILRKTLGFEDKITHKRKVADRISGSQLAEMTDIDPRNIPRTLKGLESKNIIRRDDNKIFLNKEFFGLSSDKNKKIIKDDDKFSSDEMDTKETKETTKEKYNSNKFKKLTDQGLKAYFKEKQKLTNSKSI